MKTFYKILLLLIYNSAFITSNSFSQAPGIEWAKCLGGSDRDEAHSVQQTKDGGYIVGGVALSTDGDITSNKGGNDFWIVKLDNAGSIQWQKNFGGSAGDYAYSIQQTFDSGYIISGHTNSNNGDVTGFNGGSANDYWIVKLDSVGTLQWQNCLGGTGVDQSYSIIQSSDSGYLAVGYAFSNDSDVTGNHGGQDIWAVKLDTSGIIQWKKCYGGTSNDQGFSVIQCKDGGYIIAGRTQSNDGDVSGFHGFEDYWVIKIDALGTLQWQKCYGGSNSERAHCIRETSDNGYIITGFTMSNNGDVSGNHGNQDVWTVKIDSAGTIQWQKCYGGSASDEGNFITETFSGGYIVAGLTYSNDFNVTGNHGLYDYWILKLDVNGTIEWQKCFGGTLDDIAYCIRQTTDSGYIIAGVSLSNDGDVSGNHDTTGGASYLYDYWIVKLFPDNTTSISDLQIPNTNLQIFPNPSSGIFQITFPSSSNQKTNYTLNVINTLGQTVYQAPLPASPRWGEGSSALSIDLSFLPKGIYILKISDGTSTSISKLIFE